MAGKHGARVSLDARLGKLEDALSVQESWLQRQQRKALARWIEADPEAARLVARTEALAAMPGGQRLSPAERMLRQPEGIALIIEPGQRWAEVDVTEQRPMG